MFGTRSFPMPREAVIDQLCLLVNGSNNADVTRYGFMSRERAARVLDMLKTEMKESGGLKEPRTDLMHKSVTISTGLTYYDLRAPALNMYPTVTPIRNMLPRREQAYPGDTYHYEVVLNTFGSGLPTMGYVPEGQRSASMAYQTTRSSSVYATFGEEDSVTEEALVAADGFEDESSLVQLRSLLRLMVKEEMALLGGNLSLPLGTAPTPTVTTSGSGSSIVAGTYSSIVVGLTTEGLQNASLTNGITQSLTITGNDNKTYTLNGGSSAPSAASAAVAVAAGADIVVQTAVLGGAAGYAWFVGAAGQERLQAITGSNSVTLSSLATATQLASALLSSDHSTNTTAINGLMTVAQLTDSGAYVETLSTGTSLTASSNGGVTQIDNMLFSLWDNSFLSPTVIYANATGIRAVSDLVLSSATTPLMRYYQSVDSGAPDFRVTTQGVVAWYFNPYTADGGMKIAMRAHPFMGSGNLLAWTEVLPPWYRTNAIPASGVVVPRQDYYTEIWPRTTRAQYYGIYTQEALAVYAPFSIGLLNNVTGA